MSIEFHVGILPNRPVADCLALGLAAEELGYAGVWVADSHSVMRDAFAILAVLAARTGRIALATGVTQTVTRHPAVLANSIATLHELSGGRAILGIGNGEWTRPWWMISASVDAFWLLLMMRSGVPAVVLIVLAIAVLIYRVTARIKSVRDKDVRRLARGWLISATAQIMIAFTVHYWNALYAYFFYVLGLGGWLADPLKAKKTVPVAERLEESLPADAPIPRPRREPADVESGYGHGYGAPGYAT